ncbi:protein kinase family protein [Streptosporangium sp. LJ11]|uniref:protein kinase family protein n=1 Tax=Streptosporangium sp. LJ11 TaxID=3436927 RepID=UPI003F794F62
MTRPDPTRAARVAAYSKVSTHLALLGDRRLGDLVEGASMLGAGIGGASAALEVEGVRVFVKKVPLTEPELRPENVMSTANLFGLPAFYQYGLGSAGFGAWRELAVHTMATNWVLGEEHQGFPLLYHWRVLPGPPPSESAVFAEFGDLEGAVGHWEGSPAVRERLEAIRSSPASVVLFLEHVPQTLAAWLPGQDLSAYAWVDAELAETVAFMRSRRLVHFDAHFHNVLTDGHRLYFSDFGLALSPRFELSAGEAAFLTRHRDYDRAYTAAHLVNHHLAERVRGGVDRDRFVRDWANGDRPSGVPTAAVSVLTRHARTAVVMDEFHRRLCDESKESPYPETEIARCHALSDGARARSRRTDTASTASPGGSAAGSRPEAPDRW